METVSLCRSSLAGEAGANRAARFFGHLCSALSHWTLDQSNYFQQLPPATVMLFLQCLHDAVLQRLASLVLVRRIAFSPAARKPSLLNVRAGVLRVLVLCVSRNNRTQTICREL
jgi:hypothetical protein